MNLYKKFIISDNIGIGVVAKPGEPFEYLLKRFKKVISKSGILKEFNAKRYFEKPSVKRQRRRMEAINRQKQQERKDLK